MDKTFEAVGAYRISQKSKLRYRAKQALFLVFGAIAGSLTGMLGGGGGSLVVPLYQGHGLDQRRAHATAIATILPLSIIGSGIYLAHGDYQMVAVAYVSVGVVIGGALGAVALKRINPTLLSLAFYAIMIYAGVKTLLV